MKFKNEIENATIIKAADLVTKHCRDEEFLKRVSEVREFYYSKMPGFMVAQIIKNEDVAMKIKSYKTFSPWSKVIGYASNGVIYCNIRKFDLCVYKRANNFMHEPLHELGFKHKGNSATEENLDSVPYKVGAIFEAYLREIYA